MYVPHESKIVRIHCGGRVIYQVKVALPNFSANTFLKDRKSHLVQD